MDSRKDSATHDDNVDGVEEVDVSDNGDVPEPLVLPPQEMKTRNDGFRGQVCHQHQARDAAAAEDGPQSVPEDEVDQVLFLILHPHFSQGNSMAAKTFIEVSLLCEEANEKRNEYDCDWNDREPELQESSQDGPTTQLEGKMKPIFFTVSSNPSIGSWSKR